MFDRSKYKGASVVSMQIKHNKISLEREMHVFKEYITDFLISTEKNQKKLEQEAENIVFEREEDREQFDNFYIEKSDKHFSIYPTLFQNSVLITLYSLFETRLVKICNLFSRIDESQNTSFENFKNGNTIRKKSEIEKCNKYITTVLNINLSDINAEWEIIVKYGKIRNAVVHNNSNINKKKKVKINRQPLYQMIKNNKYLNLDEQTGEFKIIDDMYLFEFCDLIEKYLFNIYERAEQKIRNA